ncbi:MAG: type I restriction endonuclease subunit M [Syntrophobacteraceae bacterium]|jgi:hypothetical protein
MNTTFKNFSLGQIVATPGALEAVPPERLLECLALHAHGNFGNVCPEDAELNNRATHEGTRILSAYPIDPAKPCKGHGDNCIWIITEADRSSTCILLPEEY